MITILRGSAILAAAVFANNVSAGGLWLNQFGDFSGGRAAAGAAAGTDDAATIFYNPAGIRRLEGNHFFASAGVVKTDLNFDVKYSNPINGYDDGGNAGGYIPGASMAYVQDLDSDKWSVGVSFGGISGAGMDYHDQWAGRYQATKVDLAVLALSPTVAYQVTDHLSVGASLQAVYADLKIDLALPRPDPARPDGKGKLDGNDFRAAYTLGTLYEPAEGTRFGLFYQSKVTAKFDGDFQASYTDVGINGEELGRNVATDTELTFAEYVRFGVHQDMNEQWGVDFTVGWDNWSQLGNVLISAENGAAGIPTQWRDTYHYAWGAQYKLDKYWEFTGGVAYDSNPVDSEYRNAQLPVDRQISYAVGARYKLQENILIGGYINYTDLGKARITAKRFGGDFDYNNALALMTNVSWTF